MNLHKRTYRPTDTWHGDIVKNNPKMLARAHDSVQNKTEQRLVKIDNIAK